MMSWWSGLSKREKLLLSIMGGLIAVLAVSLLIIRPVTDYNQQAGQNLTAAQNLSRMVDQAAIAASMQERASVTPESLRGVITRSAQQAGLRWINIRTNQEEQSLTISFSVAPAGDFFVWLQELQVQHGIIVREARLSDTRNNDGTIDASVTFAQGS
ncbi:MAG: type II secretion system protein M [Aquisalinus sp.]|nr:type II secretion system protein M [Aquisalinus sp.]